MAIAGGGIARAADKEEAEKPAAGDKAEAAEAAKPEGEKPEAAKPEGDKPEAAKPEGDKADKPEGDKPGDKAEAADEEGGGPLRKVKAQIVLTSLGKLDLGAGSFNAEFYLILTCETGDDCKVKPDIGNGSGKFDKVSKKGNETTYRVKAELIDDLDLADYPLDQHELSIEIIDRTSEKSELEFVPASPELRMDPRAKLPGFKLELGEQKSSIEPVATGEEFSQFTANLHIKRIVLGTIFKSMMPVFFMVIIAFLALMLRVKSVPNRLAMGTASLLAAVMFHVSSTSSLPPIGYLTRTDKFMIVTYIVLVVGILSSVTVMRLDEKKDEKGVNKVHNLALIVMPVMAVIGYALVLGKIV